jgi:D-aspartate ligase
MSSLIARRTTPGSWPRSGGPLPLAQPLACVLGDTDLLRPLGLGGIPCVVVADLGAPARFSRFARAALEWADAWERPRELVEILMRFGANQPEPPILFYQEDADLLVVSRHRNRLRQVFRFVVPDATLVEDLVDKSRFQVMAARAGLPVPAARRLIPSELPHPWDLDLRFPVVIKPLTRRNDVWEPVGGLGKAHRVDSPEALGALWPRLAAAGIELLIQELIPGPETRIESYHVYVDAAGEVVGEFTGRKLRTYPREYGHSTALVITDAPDVVELGRELVRRLDLRGVAKFDFKRGPDGKLYLLEINPRFTLWNHPGALAGVNLPVLVYRDLAGLPRRAVPRARPGVRWCKVWKDWAAARAAGVPLAKWVIWAWSCEAKRHLSWDDPLPLMGGALWRLSRAVQVPTRR